MPENKAKVQELGKLIGANQYQLPTYGKSRDFEYSHVEVDEVSYHLVTDERGQELERKSTTELSELLYYIFLDATSNISCNFELENRIEDQDSRRIAFAKQIELMQALSPDFEQKVELYLTKILEKYPYDDELMKKLNQSSGG